MYKKICIILTVVLLFACSACGKKMEENTTTERNETKEKIVETKETEAIIPTETMIEYSLPQGEGVESIEESAFDTEKENNSSNTQQTEKPIETTPIIDIKKDECDCEYSLYLKMTAAEQEAYMNTFASPLDFIEWSKNALAEHETHDTSIQASGGDLDISDYIN